MAPFHSAEYLMIKLCIPIIYYKQLFFQNLFVLCFIPQKMEKLTKNWLLQSDKIKIKIENQGQEEKAKQADTNNWLGKMCRITH